MTFPRNPLPSGGYLVPDLLEGELLVFRPMGLKLNEYGHEEILTDVLAVRDRTVGIAPNVKVKQKFLVPTLKEFLPQPGRDLENPEERITAGYIMKIQSPWVLAPHSLRDAAVVRKMCRIAEWIPAEDSD
ncbi:hypothetical protein ACFTWH_08540 [Streptomyces sp. NPDC057011]|uniref:hypothetical protein n=1 Tax=unclassified Streptomyces TaxID=2593676 RepID=UPI00362D12A9